MDPRIGNIHLDANALEPPSPADKLLVPQFKKMKQDHGLSVVNPHGVQVEIDDPRTPTSTKRDMEGIYTIPTNLTPEEQKDRSNLQALLRGGAALGKHAADADHIFEAAKYGGRYFVTHDKRLLKRKKEIAEITGDGLMIVTLREFMDICESFGLT